MLLPFFVAWLLAYLIHPLVKFTQYKLHVPTRALSIVVTLIFIIAVIFGVCYLIFPPMIEQFEKLGVLITRYVQDKTDTNNISQAIQEWLRENNQQIQDLLKQKDVTDAIKSLVPGVFNMLGQTANIIISVVASYEYLTSNWIRIFPKKSRPFWQGLASDVERELNNYIRGQSLVALIMGILFCIGFTIIDFPMAIGLGILIGIMDLVPYLHTFALIPTAFLALLKAVDTGQNFWMILGAAVAVFCIVQVIIDLIVTPKIMGKAMRLNPAPLTTIIMAYYKRYITKEEDEEEEEEKLNEPRKSIFSRILKRKEALKEMSAKAAETTNADATATTTATEENKKSTE